MALQYRRQGVRPGTNRHTRGDFGLRRRGKRESNGWQQNGAQHRNAEQLAQVLGWFSIGLGLAEVTAPRGIARLVGVQGKSRAFIRLLGLREIAHGIGILTQRRPVRAVWSRVVGDAIDLACLGAAFLSPRARRERVAAATAAVIGVTLVDVYCAEQLSYGMDTPAGSGALRVQKSVIVNRPPEEVYQFWHNFQNLPRFMYHLKYVQPNGQGRSHWVAKAPAGTTVEWDAEVTADQPNRLIAWRSLEGSDVDHTGSVRFERAPGGRGTIVRVEITYSPPGGVLGAGLAKLFGEAPEQQLQDDLRRFKQVIETGEVIRSEASLEGPGVVMQRPAQPPVSVIE